jgi:hypothetical protein
MKLLSSSVACSLHCKQVNYKIFGDTCQQIQWKHKSLREQPKMMIVPISRTQLSIVAPKTVTTEQWKAYWGVNKVERLQRVMESVLVAYGGAWLAWFLSFMTGNFVSAILGSGLIFNWMVTPYINSVRSNNSLWYKKGKLMHHALFKGTIAR